MNNSVNENVSICGVLKHVVENSPCEDGRIVSPSSKLNHSGRQSGLRAACRSSSICVISSLQEFFAEVVVFFSF